VSKVCSTHGRDETCMEPERKIPLERRGRESNIKRILTNRL
jgi:hypothetical protein